MGIGAVSGKKVLKVCGVKVEKVEMIFPKYPSSGDATEDPILSVEWKKHMVAYNAMVIDPCNDDYKFGKKPHPISKTDGVYSYQQTDKKDGRPHQKDIWETEHVVDAQIVKLFFRNMFQMVADPPGGPVVERDEIPQKWVSSDRGKAETQDQCSYLEQFWNKRWAAPKEDSAMKHLLSVYPGFEDHKTEMLLLPGRLNNKKAQLFGLDGHNVISTEEFSDMPFHQRIEELRELVLLIEYLNTPDVAKYFKALSVRIRDRLAEIEAEGDDAYMRQTDDWWFNKKKQQKNEEDQNLKDADDGKYKSVKLASRWSTWINSFVQIRVGTMQDLLVELTYDLEKDWEDAKTYAELLAPAKKPFVTDFDRRLKALKTHNTVRVNLQSYLI